MMPSRHNDSSPSVKRYTSEPRLRQKRFPSRLKRIRESAVSVAPAHRRQQTLTQLDFFDKDNEADQSPSSECNDSDWDSPRARKRHRPSSRHSRELQPIARQTTLTQMGALLDNVDDSQQEQFEIAVDPDVTDANMGSPTSLPRDSWNNPFTMSHGLFGDNTDQATHEETLEPPSESSHVYALPPHLRTPIRASRHIVPSSQSPSEPSLSADEDHHTESKAPNRAPLQEIHPNILAMRDEIGTHSHKSAKHRSTSVDDSLPCKESKEGSDENWDPSSSEKAKVGTLKRKQPATHYHPIASSLSRAPSSASSDETADETADESTTSTPFLRSSFRSAQPSYELTRSSPITAMGSSPSQDADGPSPFKKPALPRRLLGFERGKDGGSPPNLRGPFCVDSQEGDPDADDEFLVHSLNDTGDIVTASQMLGSSAPDS